MGISVAWENGVDVRHLQFFVATADAGSFSAAAQRVLYRSQPAVTEAIHELESRLGVMLFERRVDGVRLTEAGLAFLPLARTVMDQLDQAIQSVRSTAGGRLRTIHVGYADSPTQRFRDPALKILQQSFPQTEIQPHDLDVGQCLSDVAKRVLDFAINVKPLGKSPRGIVFDHLANLSLHCAVHEQHLCVAQGYVSVEQLQAEGLVAFSQSSVPQYMQDLRRMTARSGYVPRVVAEYDGIRELLVGVAGKRGVALLLEGACDATEGVCLLPVKPPFAQKPLGLIYRKSSDPLLRQMIGVFAKLVRRMITPG